MRITSTDRMLASAFWLDVYSACKFSLRNAANESFKVILSLADSFAAEPLPDHMCVCLIAATATGIASSKRLPRDRRCESFAIACRVSTELPIPTSSSRI